ncbi:MAG: HAD family hydrolase [Propioniciclava sp.]
MIRLIAADLDGTLLGADGRIAPNDVEALTQARACGVDLVIATGRPARWLSCLRPLTALSPTVLISNGAAEFDLASGTIVRRSPVPTADVVGVGAALRQAFPGVLLALEQGLGFGCEPGWFEHAHTSMVPEGDDGETPVAAWETLIEQVRPVVKILALAANRRAEDFAEAAAAVIGARGMVTHSAFSPDAALLEISAPGVSKASALAGICRARGINPGQVAAFGDMPNDASMLAFAGHGFAMADAHPSLRARFTVVGAHTAGGVGNTVRELLAQP